MGWNNPPVRWREFERRLSWRQQDKTAEDSGERPARPVTQLPAAGREAAGPTRRRGLGQGQAPVPWAELHCHSAYSFLDGASTPGELIAEAAECGLTAIAITDHDGMYGVPQFAQSAARFRNSEEGRAPNRRAGFGAEPSLDHPAAGPAGRRPPGRRPATGALAGGAWAGARARGRDAGEAAVGELRWLTDRFGRATVAVELISNDLPGDDERNDALFELARREGLGVIATNNVHHAAPADAKLAQVLAAIRARSSLDDMDGWLAASGTAYIRTGAEMAHRLRRYPGVLERTVELARQCAFDFKVIAPKLPDFPVPPAHTEMSWLRALVEENAPECYGQPDSERVPVPDPQSKPDLD